MCMGGRTGERRGEGADMNRFDGFFNPAHPSLKSAAIPMKCKIEMVENAGNAI